MSGTVHRKALTTNRRPATRRHSRTTIMSEVKEGQALLSGNTAKRGLVFQNLWRYNKRMNGVTGVRRR